MQDTSGNPDWPTSSKILPQMTQIDADKNTKIYLRDLRAKWDGWAAVAVDLYGSADRFEAGCSMK